MPIRYYPLTRIIQNLYTRGGEYFNPDGTPYIGRYYRTYDNKAFAGSDPVTGTNVPLISVAAASKVRGNRTAAANTYTQVAALNTSGASIADSDAELEELKPYYPIPTSTDYARGYFTRYFAKNVTGPGYVVEISQDDWSKIQDGNISPNILAYETTTLLWQLTGPLKDTRVSQYQVIGGVYDTNKRVTEAKAKGFVGLLAFIGEDYIKFAKITP